METYKAMKDRHQNEVNALPLAFAFSKEQYRDKLAEWRITPEEARAGAVVGIGGGGFCKLDDLNGVLETFRQHTAERQAAIDADLTGTGFIYEMFMYELANHEYTYTGDIMETLDALKITADDLEQSEALRNGLKKAVKTFAAGADPFDE